MSKTMKKLRLFMFTVRLCGATITCTPCAASVHSVQFGRAEILIMKCYKMGIFGVHNIIIIITGNCVIKNALILHHSNHLSPLAFTHQSIQGSQNANAKWLQAKMPSASNVLQMQMS